MDEINDFKRDNGQKWYPMYQYNAEHNFYKPDVATFAPNEYGPYLENVRRHYYKHKLEQKIKERERLQRIFEDRDEKMMQHLLKTADEIKQGIGGVNIGYNTAKWSGNKEWLDFKTKLQREHYCDALTDVINWFNTHENKKYNDGLVYFCLCIFYKL